MSCSLFLLIFASIGITALFGQSVILPPAGHLEILEHDAQIHILNIGESNISINCTAFGNPPPQDVIWERTDGKSLESLGLSTSSLQTLDEFNVRRSLLIAFPVNQKIQGSYECTTRDPTRKKVEIRMQIATRIKREKSGNAATIWTFITVVIITLLAVGVCNELRRRKNRVNSQEIQFCLRF